MNALVLRKKYIPTEDETVLQKLDTLDTEDENVLRKLVIFFSSLSGLTGLEPAASALTGRCSDRLNYNPRKMRCTASTFSLHSNY